MGAGDGGGGGGGPDRQRFEGLGNSGPNLVNQLASLGEASRYAVTPAAATKQKPPQTPFHMVWKDTPQVDFKAHLIFPQMCF